MEFALSYEKSYIRLMVTKIRLGDLEHLFAKESEFNLKKLCVWVELPILEPNNESIHFEFYFTSGIYSLEELLINNDGIIEKSELNLRKNIDFNRLRVQFNLPLEITEKQVLLFSLKKHLQIGDITELHIINKDVEIKYYENSDSICFSFKDETYLNEFTSKLLLKFHSNNFNLLKESIHKRMSTASNKFKAHFPITGASNRIEALNRKI
jgi:hypothetical protein